MERVEFYSGTNFFVEDNLKVAENILNDFDSSRNDYSINDIIEFYNITKYIDDDVCLQEWSEDDIHRIKKTAKEYKRIVSIFFKSISDEDFVKLYEKLERDYKHDFWELMTKYKIYETISENEFGKVLKSKGGYLFQVLEYKKIVEQYGEVIRKYLLEDETNGELILRKYEIKNTTSTKSIYLPSVFTNLDKEMLIQSYVRSSHPNMNYLKLIVNIQSRKEFEISDKIRLEAKKRIEVEGKKIFTNSVGIEMTISVGFSETQEDAFISKFNGKDLECTYSLKWIQDNMDYNTLLNNFICLFEYVDRQNRVNLVSKECEIGIFQKYMSLSSKKSYITGIEFNRKSILSYFQLIGYYELLEKQGIRIEEIIEWFFKDYILKEFNMCDFRITMPSRGSSYLEKCRAILPEMESILKQYRLSIQDGKVDHELLQMSSGHILFEDCKSLVNNKYIYPNEGYFQKVAYYFFSDQCMLLYIKRIDDKYKNFYELVTHESIEMDDYSGRHTDDLKWLLDNGHLKINSMGYIEIADQTKLLIFMDLNYNEVINYWRYPSIYRQEINNLVEQGILIFEDTLFSKPEQDYFNYYLNKATFNNGLDLRNTYVHGTQPNDVSDEIKHKENYMIFIKLFILIIIKINDELCIVDTTEYIEKGL